MSGIEMRPRKPRKPIKQERQSVEPTIVAQIEEDLRDLFRSAENSIAILLQTMETDEFKDIVSEELANPVKALLQTLTFLNEDDFVAKVIDQWFQIFRQEQQREATGVKELLEYIVQNLAQLQSLGGEEKYMNEKSGTSIHVLKSI